MSLPPLPPVRNGSSVIGVQDPYLACHVVRPAAVTDLYGSSRHGPSQGLPCPYATLGYSLPFLIGLHVIRHAIIVALLRFLVSLFVCCGAISRIGVYNNSVESKAFHVAAVQGVRGNALHFVAYV